MLPTLSWLVTTALRLGAVVSLAGLLTATEMTNAQSLRYPPTTKGDVVPFHVTTTVCAHVALFLAASRLSREASAMAAGGPRRGPVSLARRPGVGRDEGVDRCAERRHAASDRELAAARAAAQAAHGAMELPADRPSRARGWATFLSSQDRTAKTGAALPSRVADGATATPDRSECAVG